MTRMVSASARGVAEDAYGGALGPANSVSSASRMKLVEPKKSVTVSICRKKAMAKPSSCKATVTMAHRPTFATSPGITLVPAVDIAERRGQRRALRSA